MNILDKYNGIKGKHIAPLTGICSPEEFFNKYADIELPYMDKLKQDLHNVVNDVKYIKKRGFENTAWAIDFSDSLNTLSEQI